MKQVLFQKRVTATVNSEDLKSNPIIGFLSPTTANSGKGYLHREHNCSAYHLYAVHLGVSQGNFFGSGAVTLQEAMTFLSEKGFSVYSFDTEQELFAWLAKP